MEPKPSSRMKRIMKQARLLLLALMNMSGVTTTLCLIFWLIFRERISLTALFGALMPLVFLPSILFAIIAIMIGGWRTLALQTFPVLVFVLMYSAYLLPRPPAYPGYPNMTFLTFNLHTDPDAKETQAAVIREASADVVALQELSAPTAQYFKTALADLYPYQTLYTDGMWVMGRGILSRYPLSNDRLLKSGEREIVLAADVQLAYGNTFTIYSVHLSTPNWAGIVDYNSRSRSAEVQDLLKLAAQESKPMLIMGDFNASDASNDVAAMATHYGEACQQRCYGLAATFPATEKYPFPANLFPSLIRLDYIFFDGDWQATSAEVWHSSGGSDHRPLKATLALLKADG